MRRASDARLMALRCLIVDDCRYFLDAARALLEREGLAVVGVASTIAEALRRVQHVKPDVALVDVELGNESGFDLVRRIRSETNLDPSKVIMISTCTDEDLGDLITDAPAAAFLSKSRLSARAIFEILGDTVGTGDTNGTGDCNRPLA